MDEPTSSELEYTLARNFLAINNAQRVGSISNMTLQHIRKAREENGSMVTIVRTFSIILFAKDLYVKKLEYGIQGLISFQIPAHKTGHVSPATIVFTLELWRQMQIFLRARSCLPGMSSRLEEDSAPVFTTYPSKTSTPQPMNSSTLQKGLKSIWAKSGQRVDYDTTRMRKSTVTTVQF
jgi:hypothetical protein